MLTRILTLTSLLVALFSTNAGAVYFPSGIDWTNPSPRLFVLSVYLNTLGRAPETSELRSMTQRLSTNDTSQTRLDLFKQFIGSREYRRLFPESDKSWRVFRAPDMNHNRGNGTWRYQAGSTRPAGFQSWELSGESSESVARAMAEFYGAYCYAGIPCAESPEDAARRADPVIANQATNPVHACADESAQRAIYEWVSFNGTTYPRGTDANTLCMGSHYYEAAGSLLKHFQCERGYTNCRHDSSRDIRGERTGRDDNGNPTLFFSDGSRLTLTNYDELWQSNQQSTGSSVTANQHACADSAKITQYYQWQGTNGTTESYGVGNDVVCMDNYYYVIEGTTLRHHSCDNGFSNCRATPNQDVAAQRRTQVEGRPALQFRNGTTLSLLDKAPSAMDLSGANTNNSVSQPVTEPAQRLAGQHECGVSTERMSQFRWSKNDGTSVWPDGVNGEVVCMDNAYYQIDGFVLRHFQCSGEFQNCRQSRGKDLIALRESTNANGLRTLTFANGDQLSLISQ